MQNKSYDRYVDLLRAAELQAYERTSSRFIATIGTASGTGSWLLRNPITVFIATLSTLVVLSIAAFVLRPDGKTVGVTHSRTTITNSNERIEVRPVASSEARSTKLTEAYHSDPAIKQSAEKLDALPSASTFTESAPSTAPPELPIDEATIYPNPEVTEIASGSIEALHIRSLDALIDQRTPHKWSVSIGMNGLPQLEKSFLINARTNAMLEAGNGFAFGIAVGVHNQRERSSLFVGFKDTLGSKIGQFRSTESASSFLEAGIAASYHVLGLSELDQLRPYISIFAGFEGKSPVLEQSIGVNWMLGEQYSLFGGASLREYPAGEHAVSLSPQLGVRMLF